jgi:hypothetical protein
VELKRRCGRREVTEPPRNNGDCPRPREAMAERATGATLRALCVENYEGQNRYLCIKIW